jgi:hypothetical protein
MLVRSPSQHTRPWLISCLATYGVTDEEAAAETWLCELCQNQKSQESSLVTRLAILASYGHC